jgi:CHAD domain-containing protein
MAGRVDSMTTAAESVRRFWLGQLSSIEEHLAALLQPSAGEYAARERVDAHVHDLRVAARRCQSVALAFKPYLPGRWPKEIFRTLKPLRKACDQVRDLDVLLDWLTSLQQPNLITAGLIDCLHKNRALAMRNLCDFLGDGSCKKSIHQLAGLLQKPLKKTDWSEYRLVDLAPAVLMARLAEITIFHAKIDQAGNPDAVEKYLHRLRIAGKDFRYTLEMLQPALNEKSQVLRNQFNQFQDSLGALHDRMRYAEMLSALAEANQLPKEVFLGLDSELSREKQLGWQSFFTQWQTMTTRNLAVLILAATELGRTTG